ncbi:MAG: NUDIX hydrolase [Patescibacteria group bacterium]|jgi:8-oxo-dGTP diphosphatase
MITCKFENNAPGLLRHVTVDGLVIHGDKILLIKRAAHLIEGGKFSLPGGYLDRDETAEKGMLREIQEETGYTGTIKMLFRINTNPLRKGEDRQNVDFVFVVEAGEQTTKPDNEVNEIRWFPLGALPHPDEFAFDHFESIELYRQYLKNPTNLPIVS